MAGRAADCDRQVGASPLTLLQGGGARLQHGRNNVFQASNVLQNAHEVAQTPDWVSEISGSTSTAGDGYRVAHEAIEALQLNRARRTVLSTRSAEG